MNEELEKKLCEKYPEMFKGTLRPVTESLMCFGCQCADGWYRIIDDVCRYLHTYASANRLPMIEFTQIKEKYGSLRMYYKYAFAIRYGIIPVLLSHCSEFVKRKFGQAVAEKIFGQYAHRKTLVEYADIIDNTIEYAEFMSEHVCEICGSEGCICINDNGWYRTLCETHMNLFGFKAVNGGENISGSDED